MTDFSDDFGVNGAAGEGSRGHASFDRLRTSGDGPPARDEGGEERSRFGRGWIPGDRDIGLPGDDVAEAEWWCPTARGPCRAPAQVEAFVPHTAWDAARKVRFLDHLSAKGDVRAACALVGMSRTSAYLLRRREPVFARAWQAALVLARAHVEEVLATRALDGTEEAVWFRGELVGMKRRYDARLLLAHLGRLDKAADEMAQRFGAGEEGALAARFDETLALVAGEEPGGELVGAEVGAGSGNGDSDGRVEAGAEPDPLPLARAAYVAASAEQAWFVANDAWIDTAEAIDRAFADEHGFAPDELPDAEDAGPAAPVYPPAPDRAAFEAAGMARWDAWQARAFAAVDALLGSGVPDGDAPAEFKSLSPAGRGAPVCCEACKPCKPAAMERVRVSEIGAGGNRAGTSPLYRVKAGAALPPPPKLRRPTISFP